MDERGQDFLNSPESPYSKGKGEGKIGRLGAWARKLPQAPNSAADWLSKKRTPTPGSETYLNQNPVSRREFLRLFVGLGVTGLISAALYELEQITHIGERLFEGYQARTSQEDPKKREAVLQGLEVGDLLILQGPEAQTGGIKGLGRDIAIIAGRSRNIKGEMVNFSNRSTWTGSEIDLYFQGLNRFSGHILTQEGREKLKQFIPTAAGLYADQYNQNIVNFETFLTRNKLPNNVQEPQLRLYFTAPKTIGGLAYEVNDADVYFEAAKVSSNQSLSPDGLKGKVNQLNLKNGVGFTIR